MTDDKRYEEKYIIVKVDRNFPGDRRRYACQYCPAHIIDDGCDGNPFMCPLPDAKEAVKVQDAQGLVMYAVKEEK